jgi:spore coat protein U-like protein
VTSLRIIGLAGLVACAVLAAAPANAAYSCSVAVVGVNFGPYDPLPATPDDSAGRLDVTCTNVPGTGVDTVGYDVTLSSGTAGIYAPRQLAAGSARLDYNLYADGGRSQVWGNGSGGSVPVSGSMKVGPGVGNGSRTNRHDIFGRIPARQDVAAGVYSDTIVVTVTF